MGETMMGFRNFRPGKMDRLMVGWQIFRVEKTRRRTRVLLLGTKSNDRGVKCASRSRSPNQENDGYTKVDPEETHSSFPALYPHPQPRFFFFLLRLLSRGTFRWT